MNENIGLGGGYIEFRVLILEILYLDCLIYREK